MQIHEYQAKELLKAYDIATPGGFPCFSADEAVDAAVKLGGSAWLVKAQVHAREQGGVQHAGSIAEVRRHAAAMLGHRPAGRLVKRLLVEEAVDVRQAWTIGLALDRGSERIALTASRHGDASTHTVVIDPTRGLTAKRQRIGVC